MLFHKNSNWLSHPLKKTKLSFNWDVQAVLVAILFAGSFAKVVGQFDAMFGWLNSLSLPLVPELSASILWRHLSVGRRKCNLPKRQFELDPAPVNMFCDFVYKAKQSIVTYNNSDHLSNFLFPEVIKWHKSNINCKFKCCFKLELPQRKVPFFAWFYSFEGSPRNFIFLKLMSNSIVDLLWPKLPVTLPPPCFVGA